MNSSGATARSRPTFRPSINSGDWAAGDRGPPTGSVATPRKAAASLAQFMRGSSCVWEPRSTQSGGASNSLVLVSGAGNAGFTSAVPQTQSNSARFVVLRATVPTGSRRSLASAPLPLFDARRDGSHPAVWRFPCRPPTAGCADRRSAFPGQRVIRLVVVRICQSGGGGGNRTRVRKSSATTSTCISGLWAGTRARRRLSLFRSRVASTRRIAARNLSLVLTDGSGRPPAKPA